MDSGLFLGAPKGNSRLAHCLYLLFLSSLRGSLHSSLRFCFRSPIPFPTRKRTSESAGCCIRCQRPHAGGLPKAQDAASVTNGLPHEDFRKLRMLYPMPAASRKRTSESAGFCIPPFACSSLGQSRSDPQRPHTRYTFNEMIF